MDKQKGLGIIVTLFILVLAFQLLPQKYLFFSWVIGVILGFVMERSRFCFLSAFTDLFITGNTSLLRAVLIALLISSFGFAFLQYNSPGPGITLGYVAPVGFHIVIGATMFGIGMILAGGCASGSLMRLGEGFFIFAFVLVGLMLGTLWGARDFEWWHENFIAVSPAIHLAELIGWPAALIIQTTVLLGIFILLVKFEKERF